MALKTNYKDDVLNATMNGKRRYRKTDYSDGTFSLEDVTTYDQVGDDFAAKDVNEINKEVNTKFDSGDVVDPMLATEGGFAADALATKKAADELNKKMQNMESNFSTATKAIGDILVAKGCSVPSGTSLSEMATLLNNNVMVPIDLGITSSNTGTLGTASASSYYSAGDNQAYKAFDSDGYTSWHSTAGMPQWIQFQFKTARIVKKIFLQNRCDDAINLQYVKTFDLLASNDNSSWKTLGSYTHSKTAPGSGAFYTVNNNTAYKYYRIEVKTAQTSYCAIGVLQFYC